MANQVVYILGSAAGLAALACSIFGRRIDAHLTVRRWKRS